MIEPPERNPFRDVPDRGTETRQPPGPAKKKPPMQEDLKPGESVVFPDEPSPRPGHPEFDLAEPGDPLPGARENWIGFSSVWSLLWVVFAVLLLVAALAALIVTVVD